MNLRGSTPDPLELLRTAEEPLAPEGAQERVAARLAAGLPLASGSGSSSQGTTPLAHGKVGAKAARTLAARFLRWSLLPLGVGIAIGGAHRQVVDGAKPSSAARSASVLAAPPVDLVASSSGVSEEWVPGDARVPASPSSSFGAAPARRPRPSDTLSEERAILDRARRRLALGEPKAALPSIDQHARRFASGALAEEREAMRIQVFVLLGERQRARSSGAAFHARFPGSLMLPSVDAALAAIDGP